MKKILIFIDAYLPGTASGGPVQSIKNLVELLKKDFEFLIITRNVDVNSEEEYKGIKLDEWQIKDSYKIKYLKTEDYYKLLKIRKEISSADVDLIYLNGVYSKSSIYVNFLSYIGLINNKILILPRGDLSNSAVNEKKIKKKFFLFVTKVLKFYNKIFWQATSEKEKKDILSFFKTSNIKNIKNLKKIIQIPKKNKKKENILNLVTASRIHPIKNIKFALDVLEEINIKANEKINFHIYGPLEDIKYWKECKEKIEKLPKNIKVFYEGNISNEEVLNEISGYDFSIFPTLGENFGHSIVESLISKTPVIISDQTPWKNLKNYGVGYDISLEDKKEWINVIKNLLKLNSKEYFSYIKNCEHYLKNEAGFYKETQKTKEYFNDIVSKEN